MDFEVHRSMIKLAEILKSRDISQAEFARLMDTSPANVSRWCSGKMKPSKPTVQKMAAVLGVEVGEITGEIPLLSDDERRMMRAFRTVPDAMREHVILIVEAASHIPTEQSGNGGARPELRGKPSLVASLDPDTGTQVGSGNGHRSIRAKVRRDGSDGQQDDTPLPLGSAATIGERALRP
jgi:transcriptional regulator with XRE-family HTH domain